MASNQPSSSTSTAVSSPIIPALTIPLVKEQEPLAAEQEPLDEGQEQALLPENPDDDYSAMETMQ